MRSLRKSKPSGVSDSYLLQQAFGKLNKRLPDEAKTEEGILTASSIWHVNNVLKQKIDCVEDPDAKQALLSIAAHFEAPLTPWRHSLGSAGLIRRMAFLEKGTLLSQYAPLFTVDFSQLLLDDQMAEVLVGNLLKSRVAEFHMLFADVPDSLRLDVFKPLRWIQFGWAIASTVLGFLVGAVLWRFV